MRDRKARVRDRKAKVRDRKAGRKAKVRDRRVKVRGVRDSITYRCQECAGECLGLLSVYRGLGDLCPC